MDFVSRHIISSNTSSASEQHGPSPQNHMSQPTAPEEQEYIARYLVVKHSWRGRYKRILCISESSIITLDPNTLSVTNAYESSDFEGAAPVLGRDEWSNEFTITARTDSRAKFKGIRFSSMFQTSILTELQRVRWSKMVSIAEFSVLHLRRRTSEWIPYKLRVTAVGVELLEGQSDDLRWCLDFRDMDSPAIILLAATFGTKNADHAGFVLCPLYGRKSKAFMATPGSSDKAIISCLSKTAKTMVGMFLSIDSSQSLTVAAFIKQRAKQALGAEETPYGEGTEWSVTKLRSAGHGTSRVLGLSLGIGLKGGLGEHGDSVSRQLILSKTSLIERRPENYEVVIVRPLSAVSSLVRFAEEPQMFAIEFNDGCHIHIYASTSRDSLLAAVRDVLQIEGQCPVPVLPRLTMPGHFVDPPCGRAYRLQQNSPAQQLPAVDVEIVSMHLKHLASSAKDAVTEGGSVPGSKAKLWRRIREFNACIPYSGVPSNTEVPEVILMALITMLPATPDLPPEAPPPPSPSPKAAATVMGFVACLRRLLSARSAASHVMSFPAAVGRIMGLLRNGSEGIAAEAAGLVSMFIGSDPGDSSALTDSKGERHAAVMHTKSVLFAHPIYAMILVSRLRPMSVSPLLSMSVVEVLEGMLCEPHGETTQHTTFVELLRQVAGLRRRLFALFGHPAKSVGETVSVVMRTIAEEDAIAAESMRDASLRDGALLRCLVEAFSLPFCERRDISRQLVALWADSYQPAMDLMSRVLPPGLVAYLHTRSDEGSYEHNQNQSGLEARLTSSRQRHNLQQRKGRKGTLSQEHITSHVSLETGVLTNQRGTSTNSVFGTDQNYIGESGSGQVPTSHFLPPGINTIHEYSHVSDLHVDATGVAPTHVSSGNSLSYLVESNHLESVNFEDSIHPDLSSPAQVFIENAPVGSGRLLCNWHEFWKAFGLDHNRADLIWNESTRRELRESLLAEVHKLDVEKERSGDIVPDDITINTVAGQVTVPQISWNHIEFSVNYQSLSDEVCVGQYYLRLLLESRSGGKAQDFPLRDPVTFFRALYHRFLCDADTGLTVDGVVPDELGSSEDWCDMGRLDGFGGGGGASVRELCARAMSIVYEQHHKTIGPFDGTAHITVLLDRTDDRALRHRLLNLLKILMKNLANVEACILVGGCVLAIDLLIVCHETSERSTIPSQSNLIASTAFMEPLKEWMFIDNDGRQVGPVVKDAIRRHFSKENIDWTTKCWASGMLDWKRLRDIRELRWALSFRVPVLTPDAVGEAALTILHSMVSAHSDLDDAGEIITPTPRVKRILSSPRCLPHVAQAMLSCKPSIVESAASLMKAIVTRNPKAMIKLYSTGAFFFALAYSGSNLLSIAQLFSMTHVLQAFHGGEEAAISSSLPLAKRSVLGGLLPESLLYVLERSGPSAFAAAMISDSDTPEIIWTHKMREEHLQLQVLQHLGDFPQKLAQHCHSLYEYAPMPPVTYPQLRDEMWCHRYYLRNLCDELRFPNWPIVEHVEFLQSLLVMWREELTRRPTDLSEEEALHILEISVNDFVVGGMQPSVMEDDSCKKSNQIKNIDEEKLKRQYKKLAMRYHPDKNPEGREKFVAVQKAYERLQATMQGLQGPQIWRLLLLLKGQCILYRRYGNILEPFKYAGYPMLLNAVTVDQDDNNFLSSDRAPLLVAASELIWLTCASSSLNGEELVRDDGIPLLAGLISRCMCVVRPSTLANDPAAIIVTNVMHTLSVLSQFEIAREEIIKFGGLVQNIIHCTELELAPSAVDAALLTAAHVCVSSELQNALLEAGALWYLLPLLFQYDATAEDTDVTEAHGVGASVQIAKNLHAVHASQTLAKLSGVCGDEISTPYNQDAAIALRALLTPKLANMLKCQLLKDMLSSLNTNLESPEIIWNSSTRTELLKFVDQQRATQGPDGSYDLKESQAFTYQALSKELHVGDVYLRVYNNQPDFEISDPDYFCIALLEFISGLVLNLSSRESEGQIKSEVIESSVEPSEFQIANSNDSTSEEKNNDSMLASSSRETNGDDSESIQKLHMGLTSLRNLLTNNPSLAALFSTNEQLRPIFECFVVHFPAECNISQICLDILSLLTAYAPCLETMVAEQKNLILLLEMLHCSPPFREGTLHVLYALASTPELAWSAAKHGGVVYILELLLPMQEEIPLQQRAAAASLLGKLLGQSMHGPRVAITLARFLPDGLVSAIRDGPGEVVITVLDQTTETPELVWTQAMAASLSAQLSTMASDLYHDQMKGQVVDWDIPEKASGQHEMRDEPQVGGIYVRLFLKDPKFPLRNPRKFLEGLLDQYLSSITSTHYDQQTAVDFELPLLLSFALVSLLRVHPALADHVGYLGYVPKLVAAVAHEGRWETMSSEELKIGNVVHSDDFNETVDEPSKQSSQTPQERVRLSCLRVLHQLASSTTCAEAMAATSTGTPQVVPLLMKTIGWQGGSILALETLKRVVVAGNRARDSLVAQGLKVGLVEVLLGLLDWRAGGRHGLSTQMKWNESDANIGRVLAVEVLRAFSAEGAHCAKVRDLLNSSDVWRAYKDQKHDLFLPSNAQSSAAGVAGLIENSSSRITYAITASPQPPEARVSPPPATSSNGNQ